MMRFRSSGSQHGVSEVVGALVLTLIVVAALSSFFLFINEQQNEYQEIERLKDRMKNEDLSISFIQPYESSGSWNRLLVSISSEWTQNSSISSLRVNDNEVKQIWTYDTSDPPLPVDTITFNSPVVIDGRDKLNFLIMLDQPADFYDVSGHTIPLDSFIKIEFRTIYGNTISRTFLPPTAVFKVMTEAYWDSTPPTPQYRQMTTLDASSSIHPGEDEYLISWSWSVISDVDLDGDHLLPGVDPGSADVETTFTGVKVRIDPDIVNTGTTHKITLTVKDNVGLIATDDMVYYL